MEDSSVKSGSDKRFEALLIVILSICAACAIFPFILLVASSLTEETALVREGYSFIPKEFSLYAYQYLMSSNAVKIFKAYGITILITVLGTCISLLIGPMLAWVLSRREKRFPFITMENAAGVTRENRSRLL